jgi:RHS repeat-associated protein
MNSFFNCMMRMVGAIGLAAVVSVATAASGDVTNPAVGPGSAPAKPVRKLAPASAAQRVQAHNVMGKLPMHFEAHTGEPGGARYTARGRGYHLSLNAGEMQLGLKKPTAVPVNPEARRAWVQNQIKEGRQRNVEGSAGGYSSVLRKSFPGANANPQVAGEDLLPGKSHYLVGKDQARWRKNIANYAKVRYRNVYRGIDLVYYGNAGRIEYDWIVAPGADPHRIVESFGGAASLRIADNGDLLITAADGPVVQKKPVVYQVQAGQRVSITGEYVLLGNNSVGFKIGPYDRSLPLTIDPVVEYSTFLGGSRQDTATSVAVNAAGEVFVMGTTESADFPGGATSGAIVPAFGQPVAYVTKLNAAGDAVMYTTYIGGAAQATGLALGADDSVYVAGYTASADFPSGVFLQSPGQPPASSRAGAFVLKLAPSGNAINYATMIATDTGIVGGVDNRVSIAVDAGGSVYLAGETRGLYFPTTPGSLQPDKLLPTRYDGYVAKLMPNGASLVYAMLYGSTSAAEAAETSIRGIAIDPAGNAYITGITTSESLPLVSPFLSQLQPNGSFGGFVAQIDPTGSALNYSSYGYGLVNAITVDRQGNALVAGENIHKIDPSGGLFTLIPLVDAPPAPNIPAMANAVATDRLGNIYVAGIVNSRDGALPQVGDLNLGGNPVIDGDLADAFVMKFAADGSAIGFSLRLGGDAVANYISQFNNSDFIGGFDAAYGIAVDPNGGIYVVGKTFSPNFPLVNALQSLPDQTPQGPPSNISYLWGDAFLTKLSEPIGGIGLFSDTNPANAGEEVWFPVILPDSTATGTVTLFDGAVALETLTVTSGGVVTFINSTLAIGTHTLIARYSGDATHPATESAPLIQTILDPNAQPTSTSTSLIAIGNPDGSITLTATVSGANPTGTLTITDNGTQYFRNAAAGPASITLANPAPGLHTVTARYAGDARNLPSDSPVVTFTAGPPQVVITQPLNGATLQYPATVQFTVDAVPSLNTTITSVALFVNGALVATLTTPPYTFPLANGPPGSYTLTARATDSAGRTSSIASAQIRIYELGTTYYHHDLQGNVVAASDGLGQVNYTESYLPYGSRQVNSPASAVAQTNGNRLWFHGKAQDEATGLQYFGARYYDPVLGRFMGVDPVGFDDGNIHSFNRFAYGNNNPYRYLDPDGHHPVVIALSYAVPIAVTFLRAALTVSVRRMSILAMEHGAAAGIATAELAVGDAIGGASLAAGAGAALKAVDKAADASKAAPSFDSARRAAFEKAGMTDASKVQFSKVDPNTGTIVEFKGQGGAKVGYDGPHSSPGPHHDAPHISWQSAGKRSSGEGKRGNEPYSGPQHPSRPDRKDQ